VPALRAGEPYRAARGLSALSIMLDMLRGQAQRAQEVRERAERVAERLKHPHLTGLCQLSQGLYAYHAGHYEVARATLAQAERTLSEGCVSTSWELGLSRFFLLMCHFIAGDLATLRRLGEEYHEQALARGDALGAANLRVRVLPSLALLEGEPDRARALAEQDVPHAAGNGLSIQAYWRDLQLVEHALCVGDVSYARERMRSLWPAIERSDLLQIRSLHAEAHWLRARVALCALRRGDRDVTPRDVLRDAAHIEASDIGGYAGVALALRASITEMRGDTRTTVAAFRGAEAQLRADGRELLAQLARLRRGMLDPDDEGQRVKREAELWLASAGVRDVRGTLAMYMP